jgi:hypothetical protein
MAVGGPQKDADNRDKVVSTSPLAYVSHVEARSSSWGGVGDQNQTLSTWWGKPTNGTTAYSLKGHYT